VTVPVTVQLPDGLRHETNVAAPVASTAISWKSHDAPSLVLRMSRSQVPVRSAWE
jgi:hypothetical protein